MSRSNNRMLEATGWVAGFALMAVYFGTRAYGELERRHAVATFTQQRSSQATETFVARDTDREALASIPAGLAQNQTRWSASRLQAYNDSAYESAESASLPSAILRIRSVALEVPVYADVTERNLNRGAGLIEGTALPDSDGNISIAAHRDGYFRVLEDVAVGDLIEIESPLHRRSYLVTDLAVVEPTDLWPLDETDTPAVTLVTCYPFYFVGNAPKRYIVRAIAME